MPGRLVLAFSSTVAAALLLAPAASAASSEASVEEDRDGNGHGDFSQDRCPVSARERLAKLPRRRSLRARIDVKATNLVPCVATREVKVKLPARKPPLR